MLGRRRSPLLTCPELDDRALRSTLAELRPAPQLHGLGAGRGRPSWEPAARLLRETGRDWDRRAHRVAVLARNAPPAVRDGWAAGRPDDGDALVLHAYALSVRAAAQGRDGAHRAEQACLRAAEACPEDPTPWLALLELMAAFAVPVRHAVPVWTEAVDRAPWLRPAYHRLLHYLSPRGHGTVADMMDFARLGAERAPHGSPLALLPVAARVELVAHRERTSTLGTSAHWNEPRAGEEIDAALNGWFETSAAPHAEALLDLNVLAFALIRVHRADEAGPVLRRVGRHMTPHPWDVLPEPERTFLYWRDRLTGGR